MSLNLFKKLFGWTARNMAGDTDSKFDPTDIINTRYDMPEVLKDALLGLKFQSTDIKFRREGEKFLLKLPRKLKPAEKDSIIKKLRKARREKNRSKLAKPAEPAEPADIKIVSAEQGVAH